MRQVPVPCAPCGFHWTTAGGGGGSISNMGSPDKNVENAINKARKDEYDYRQWLNDYNNMIGDIANGVSNYGIGYIRNTAYSVSNCSSRLNYLLDYGKIGYDVVKASSLSKDNQREIFTITMGNIGANVMGNGLGMVAAGFATELGPYGMMYSGMLGTALGRILGREMGTVVGKGIFDIYYSPYIYEPINEIIKVKKQLQNLIEYNNSHIPYNWPYPY